jgi:hypothetical protein
LLFEEGTRPRSIERAELAPDLPELTGREALDAEGADLVLARPEIVPASGEGSFVLGLLGLEDFSFREFLVEPEGDRLRARGAAVFAEELAGADQAVAWSLDYRIEGLAVARARGRLP